MMEIINYLEMGDGTPCFLNLQTFFKAVSRAQDIFIREKQRLKMNRLLVQLKKTDSQV